MSDGGDGSGGGGAEAPATSSPAERAPVPEATPEVEIEAAPTASEPPTPAPSPPTSDTSIKSRLGAAFEALRFRKRAKLDKILALAAKKKSIKNDDVEKLLRVSDSTAQRYLNQLVAEGKLRRSGTTAGITYEPV